MSRLSLLSPLRGAAVWALCLLTLALSAASPLRRPLRFVPAASVLVVDPTPANVIRRAMAVSPYLAPHTDSLSAAEAKRFARLYRRAAAFAHFAPDTLARLWLVSGDARLAAALDSVRTRRDALSAAAPTDRDAAQALLNTLGWVAGTDERGVFVNMNVDGVIRVAAPAVACDIDMICEAGRVKLRLTNVRTAAGVMALRLRLPVGVRGEDVFHNGRRLLDPRYERGYLVLEKKWRDNEEIYYDLPERAAPAGD